MTLMDLIKLGLIDSDVKAQEFAVDLVDRWHDGLIPSGMRDVLGLPRASTRHGGRAKCRC